MKYIKKFEVLDWRDVDYANIDEYKNRFVVINETSNAGHLFLVTDISFDTNLDEKIQYSIDGYSFKCINNIFNQCTAAFWSRSKEEFGGLIFLTPNEFYDQYTELYHNLYFKIYRDNQNQLKWTSNYKNLINNVLPILNSIDDKKNIIDNIKTIIDAEEFNL